MALTIKFLRRNNLRSHTLLSVLLLAMITVPQSVCQYFYHNGYYYPQQQYFQFSDQSWQYQQQQQQVQQFQQQQFAAPPPPPPQIVQQVAQQPPVLQPAPPPRQRMGFQEPAAPPPTIVLPQKKAESEARLEFDLPPPPPAMFLPEEKDKLKIAQLLAQQRNRKPKQPANRQLIQQQLQTQRNLLGSEQQTHRAAVIEETAPPQPVVEQTRPPPPPAPIQESQSSLAQLSHLEAGSNDPNKVFLSCCKHKRVDTVCESRCNFDTLNKKVLTQMFIGTDPCPQNYGLDLFSCAAQDSDHTPCCLGKKVERTSAGKKCLAFCKMTPDSHFQADATYLPCWSVLNNVKACFKEAILNKNVAKL